MGPSLRVGDVGEVAETDTGAPYGTLRGRQGHSGTLGRKVKVVETRKSILAVYEAGAAAVV